VPQEYAVSNAPRVFLNPLLDEHQAMRGRGEGGEAHKLTGLITQASQKSLVGLEHGEMGEESSSSLFSGKKEVKRSVFVRQSQIKEGERSDYISLASQLSNGQNKSVVCYNGQQH